MTSIERIWHVQKIRLFASNTLHEYESNVSDLMKKIHSLYYIFENFSTMDCNVSDFFYSVWLQILILGVLNDLPDICKFRFLKQISF